MSDTIGQKIQETAENPKRVRTDAGEVESQDLSALIEADKYLAAKAAVNAGSHRGLRFNKLVPPGTI